MSELPEKVGKLEQEMHTVRHQLSQLERLPPRVSTLERAFEGLTHVQEDQKEIKAGLQTVMASQQRMTGDIEGFGRAVKWIGGIVATAATITAAVAWVLIQ